jgi:hypothetical protein
MKLRVIGIMRRVLPDRSSTAAEAHDSQAADAARLRFCPDGGRIEIAHQLGIGLGANSLLVCACCNAAARSIDRIGQSSA